MDGKILSYKAIDDSVKIFKVTYGVIKEIMKIVSHAQFQNGTELGIMDRVEGHNLIISKEVKDDNTSYAVQPMIKPFEIDEKYFDAVPDLVQTAEEMIYTDEYLAGVTANFFYGEDMPSDTIKLRAKPKKEQSLKDVLAKKEVVKKATPKKVAAPKVEVAAEPKVTPKEAVDSSLSLMDRLKQRAV
jgi:hypothetical protein